MKKLFIIRHAKSSWAISGQSDFTRALNERGEIDAPKMAKRLIAKAPVIDLFLSSPAIRAHKTCEHFYQAYKNNQPLNTYDERLYHASQEIFYQVISELSDSINSVAVFSHNPGITDFVNSLDTGVRLDNMPTCAIYATSSDTTHWRDFQDSTKQFLFFDFPKNK